MLFLTVRNVNTLPKQIWEGIQESIDPTIAAVATFLVVLSLIATVAVSLRKKTA